MAPFSIISAMDMNRGIGKNNQLLWHLPSDMAYFVEVTMGGVLIMGRKTWESIPEKFRPFKGRVSIVLTREKIYEVPEGVLVASSLDEALHMADEHRPTMDAEVFVIGGAQLYAEAITHEDCDQIFLTLVNATFEADAFFPEIPGEFVQVESSPFQEEKGLEFCFIRFVKP